MHFSVTSIKLELPYEISEQVQTAVPRLVIKKDKQEASSQSLELINPIARNIYDAVKVDFLSASRFL